MPFRCFLPKVDFTSSKKETNSTGRDWPQSVITHFADRGLDVREAGGIEPGGADLKARRLERLQPSEGAAGGDRGQSGACGGHHRGVSPLISLTSPSCLLSGVPKM